MESIIGARLRTIVFGSWNCDDGERKFYSFTGETAAGRWEIGQNRSFQLGGFFYWLCDCLSVKDILDYDGNISMVHLWDQESIGCDFDFAHRPNRMMADKDALRRRSGKLIANHVGVASIHKDIYLQRHPDAYHHKYLFACKNSKMNIVPNPIEPRPIITTQNIMKGSTEASDRVILEFAQLQSKNVHKHLNQAKCRI